MYGIAKVEYRRSGRDGVTTASITTIDVYGSGPYPPIFNSEAKAQEWIEENGESYNTYKVVELEVGDA